VKDIEMGKECRPNEKRNVYRILVGKPERDHWEDQDVGGWTILKWISKFLSCCTIGSFSRRAQLPE
jgi:hypothetical protein